MNLNDRCHGDARGEQGAHPIESKKEGIRFIEASKGGYCSPPE